MKIVTANGEQKLQISKKEWISLGEQMGWRKKAQMTQNTTQQTTQTNSSNLANMSNSNQQVNVQEQIKNLDTTQQVILAFRKATKNNQIAQRAILTFLEMLGDLPGFTPSAMKKLIDSAGAGGAASQ